MYNIIQLLKMNSDEETREGDEEVCSGAAVANEAEEGAFNREFDPAHKKYWTHPELNRRPPACS